MKQLTALFTAICLLLAFTAAAFTSDSLDSYLRSRSMYTFTHLDEEWDEIDAQLLDYSSDKTEALKAVNELAAAGDAAALSILGRIYLFGYGVNRDIERAREYLTAAADMGDRIAQWALGYMYLCGAGFEQDADKAYELFEPSSEQGYYKALAEMATKCYHGFGCDVDYTKALEYWQKAA